MEEGEEDSTASTQSNQATISASSSKGKRSRPLDTELHMKLNLSDSSFEGSCSNDRNKKPRQNAQSLFVKVHMDGTSFGRNLDLLTQDGYQSLITTIEQMFNTTIIYPYKSRTSSPTSNILVYEDTEGDWTTVGDVPWKHFLSSIKKLKIIRAGR
uniref:Auxin-responsive protein n=1 Tax=Phalaenopsis aphrodite subsp. formosana TaxID=308872 RepID=A0A1D8DGR9_PHAAO|nr:indole-3-acetic acid inducible 30-like 1 [Phalaenopsis aphrodite subsp. formosana]